MPETGEGQHLSEKEIKFNRYIEQLGIEDLEEVKSLKYETNSNIRYGNSPEQAFMDAFNHVQFFSVEGRHFSEQSPDITTEVWLDNRRDQGTEYSFSQIRGGESDKGTRE